MAVAPFGFSVGDFTAGIDLVKDVITALSDTEGAKAQYEKLIVDLHSVNDAFKEIQNLGLSSTSQPQKLALEQIAAQCQNTIANFLKKNAKFQPTLGKRKCDTALVSVPKRLRDRLGLGLGSAASLCASGTVATCSAQSSTPPAWKEVLHKIHWALCRPDDIERLRQEIQGHTLTINLLLATLQIGRLEIQQETVVSGFQQTRELSQGNRDDVACLHDLVERNFSSVENQNRKTLESIQALVAQGAESSQSFHGLNSTMGQIVRSNMAIYSGMIQFQKLATDVIPPQVLRQQPVYFEDAHGRVTPFHVEFINSFDAFQAVLEVRFREVPGFKKVQRLQYALQDERSKRQLNIRGDWASIWLPGTKVNMSILMREAQSSRSTCPGCQASNGSEEQVSGEVQCLSCEIRYQRVTGSAMRSQMNSNTAKSNMDLSINEQAEDDEEHIGNFRRVHLLRKDVVTVSTYCILAAATSSFTGAFKSAKVNISRMGITYLTAEMGNTLSSGATNTDFKPLPHNASLFFFDSTINRGGGGPQSPFSAPIQTSRGWPGMRQQATALKAHMQVQQRWESIENVTTELNAIQAALEEELSQLRSDITKKKNSR